MKVETPIWREHKTRQVGWDQCSAEGWQALPNERCSRRACKEFHSVNAIL